MTALDPIRTLAEEIAVERRQPACDVTDLKPIAARWEDRLRAFVQDRQAEPSPGQAELLGELASRHEALFRLDNALTELIDSSDGVAGLHLNGDLAEWEELLPGGRFEQWLSCVSLVTPALSGEAGKLAAAVIQASIDLRLDELRGPKSARELNEMRRQLSPPLARFHAAVDALLAATGKGERND